MEKMVWYVPQCFGAISSLGSLTDMLHARGKCSYKPIHYRVCGIPVITSPGAVNTEIVEHGVNGFPASCDAEWAGALQSQLCDPALRERIGKAGRGHCRQVWGLRVAQMLRGVANTDISR